MERYRQKVVNLAFSILRNEALAEDLSQTVFVKAWQALPKLGEAAYQFWAFKESGGGAPTTASIALQLHAHPVFDRWRTVLAEAGAPDLALLPDPALISGAGSRRCSASTRRARPRSTAC